MSTAGASAIARCNAGDSVECKIAFGEEIGKKCAVIASSFFHVRKTKRKKKSKPICVGYTQNGLRHASGDIVRISITQLGSEPGGKFFCPMKSELSAIYIFFRMRPYVNKMNATTSD